MFDLIAGILAWIYEVVGNLGISIILLTLVVMVVMTPLTLSGTKSMIKMQRLQPEIRKIQQKHKSDREKMNAEMMAFYQENNVNPVGGCLPLFFQLPVFLVLYRVLQGLTRRQVLDGGWVGSATDVAQASGAGVTAPQDLGVVRNFNPQYLDESSELFVDLSNESEIPFFFDAFDLSLSPLDALRDSLVNGVPYLLLLILVLVTSLYQQRQIQGRNPNAMANPQQAALMKIMPWFLPVISFSLQTALVLYFITSNLYRIGQQAYITRALYGEKAEAAAAAAAIIDAESTKTPPKGTGKGKNGGRDSGEGAGPKAKSKKQAASKPPAKAENKAENKAGNKAENRAGNKAKKKPPSSATSTSDRGGRRGAGAGRPAPRGTPSPSSRTGGNQSRPAKNRKKKRK